MDSASCESRVGVEVLLEGITATRSTAKNGPVLSGPEYTACVSCILTAQDFLSGSSKRVQNALHNVVNKRNFAERAVEAVKATKTLFCKIDSKILNEFFFCSSFLSKKRYSFTLRPMRILHPLLIALAEMSID